jgi:hypothetical protein
MAVTANQLIKRQEGKKRSYPVKASVVLYQGTLAYIDADGFAEPTTATGVNAFGGIVIDSVTGTSVSGGATVELWVEGDFELVGAGTYTQADVGTPIYGDDNYTINVAIGSTSVPIGRAVGYVSATKLIVDIKPTGGAGALPVAPLTAITFTAPSVADYALQDVINSSAYGFAAAEEARTFISVVSNLQKRVLDLEARR